MYFEKIGKPNTENVIKCVAEYVKAHGTSHVVVASGKGDTARLLYDALPDNVQITVVTHAIGMSENGVDNMGAAVRKELTDKGMRIVTATHVLSGAERAMSGVWGGAYPVEIIAHTLRMFGDGVKVGIECAVMALDNGAIPYGEEIVSIGGSGRGADSAIALLPGHGARIFETVINEIICKPKNFTPKVKRVKE